MTDWVQEVLITHGVLVLALLILVENLFPPIPSEVILPLAGFMVFQGDMGFVEALLAATAGATVGALILYWIGRYGGRPLLLRYRRVLRVTEEQLDRADDWFDNHGPKIVFFGRMLPGIRSIVSVPAGLSEMPIPRFVTLTALGAALWNTALIGAGWQLGDNWEDVSAFIEPLTIPVVVTVAVITVAYAYIRVRRTRSASP